MNDHPAGAERVSRIAAGSSLGCFSSREQDTGGRRRHHAGAGGARGATRRIGASRQSRTRQLCARRRCTTPGKCRCRTTRQGDGRLAADGHARHPSRCASAGGLETACLVQVTSHLYNDCGDCAQALSALNLIPLAPRKATFRAADVLHAAEKAEGGRVAAPLGAIQIESPARRRDGERFEFEEMEKISRWARTRGIDLHLDGARIFVESAYTGRSVRD